MQIESNIIKLINPGAAVTQTLPLPEAIENEVTVNVLRLDLVHPVISGNKFFKLRPAIESALSAGRKGIISFGGAWSNHLVALAFACKETGLESVGVIRGEKPAAISAMLEEASGYGMTLHFIPRHQYQDMVALTEEYRERFPDFDIVPVGGSSPAGVEGAADILRLADSQAYNIIACSVGTGTMMAGLLTAANPAQQIIGFSSLKLNLPNDVDSFIRRMVPGAEPVINYDYHFGGYAKHKPELLEFMNNLWKDYALPTDFVYTAKMLFGLREMIAAGRFPKGSRILAIQSGGLQGNRSVGDALNF